MPDRAATANRAAVRAPEGRGGRDELEWRIHCEGLVLVVIVRRVEGRPRGASRERKGEAMLDAKLRVDRGVTDIGGFIE